MTDQTTTAPAPQAAADPAAFERRIAQCETAMVQALSYVIESGDKVRTVSADVEIFKTLIAELQAAHVQLHARVTELERSQAEGSGGVH